MVKISVVDVGMAAPNLIDVVVEKERFEEVLGAILGKFDVIFVAKGKALLLHPSGTVICLRVFEERKTPSVIR